MTDHIEKIQEDTSDDRSSLRQLGWTDAFEGRLAGLKDARGSVARVVSVQRGRFLVADGRREWLCSPSGKLLHSAPADYPVTGDWVCVADSVVTGVIGRENMLSRGEAGSADRSGAATSAQPIAANIDTVFIVCGLDRDYNVRRLERYLTLVYNCGLSPVVVLTKADLHQDPEPFRREVEAIAFGVPVVTASLDGRGTDELAAYLGTGRTAAMIGSSGAGKSTLANRLYGSDIQATSAVSHSVGKGRHTTTARELIRMPQGGMLMDNPGIREIALFGDGDGMNGAFAEIRELARLCRFADCSHRHEPGCAVLEAVSTGELSRDRLENYRKMRQELEYVSARREKSADRIEKERWKGVAKRIRNMKKIQKQ